MGRAIVHTFDDSQQAYDETMARDDIRDGDLLHVPSENAVAIAGAWPVAVTVVSPGESFHGVSPGAGFSVMASSDWTVEEVSYGVALADQQGYAVATWARDVLRADKPVVRYNLAMACHLIDGAKILQGALLFAQRKGNTEVATRYRDSRNALLVRARKLLNEPEKQED